jgi:hypothetical protein
VVRFTWRQVVVEPDRVGRTLAALRLPPRAGASVPPP